jgi:hypothetical protein
MFDSYNYMCSIFLSKAIQMNNRQKKQIITAVIAVVVLYFLYKMFTKKSGFDTPKHQRRPMTQQEMDIKLSNERAAYAATSRGLKQVQSDARYAANLAHEQKKNEIKDAMRRSRQGGAEGAAGAARFAEIQNLVNI